MHPIARDMASGKDARAGHKKPGEGHVMRKVRSCGQLALTTVVSGRFSNEYMSAVLHARGGDHMWIRFTIVAVVQNVIVVAREGNIERCTFENENVFLFNGSSLPVRSSKGQQ